jgi:hypothetical protein
MRWMRHVAWVGEMRNAYQILLRKLKEWRPLERPNHRCDDNVKMYLKEVGSMYVWTAFIWLSWSCPLVGSCEPGIKSLGFSSDKGFLDQLGYYQLPKKGSAPWS